MIFDLIFRKLAVATLIFLIILINVGAIVRVTGSGMGCPDWPKCWGELVPPTQVEQVNFDQLPIDKFRKKAERMGRDPSSITVDALRKEFNPRHVWTEFINRLCSLPLGFASLMLCICGLWNIRKKTIEGVLAVLILLIILFNAWMGAKVVYSGINPAVLTTHFALAMLLIAMLSFLIYRSAAPHRLQLRIVDPIKQKRIRYLLFSLLLFTLIEGFLGTQLREMTDKLAKSHSFAPRVTWIDELEQSAIYFIHRSGSWLIFILTLVCFYYSKKNACKRVPLLENIAVSLVIAQMLLGVIMTQMHIYAWVQVLHVCLSALFFTCILFWVYATLEPRNTQQNDEMK